MNNQNGTPRIYLVATFGALGDRAVPFVRFYRFMMWIARFSTFNAASLTASLNVGCE
jgi:hypothetical protein